jgi:ABC-type branched-subunit amino acid transport system substrate-binding protein
MHGSASTRVLMALFTGLVLPVAACGSSSSSSAGSSVTFTGQPIKLVVINNTSTTRENAEVYAGADAAASAINDAGGVNGRKLVIVHCDSQITPDGTAKCARDAVADPQVLALAGSYYQYGDQVDPVLEQAKMANIGDFPQAIQDLTSVISFPTSSGALGTVAGMATLVTDVLKSLRISVPYVDVPEGTQVVQLLQGVLQTRPGASVVTKVPVPNEAPDLSASVQASTQNNPGGIIIVLSADSNLKFLQSAHSQGVTIPIVSPGAEVTPSALAALGDAANGQYVTTCFPPSGGQGNQLFTQQMDKYQSSANKDDLSKNSWLGVRLFQAAAAKATALTRQGILDAMNGLTSFDTGGMTPPLNYTQPFAGFGGTFPRMFNPTVVYNKFTNGQEVPTNPGQFANPFVPVGG